MKAKNPQKQTQNAHLPAPRLPGSQAHPPIEAAPGVAQLSNGWNAIGSVELKSHTSFAHDALWLGTRRLVAWMLMVGIAAAIAAWAGLRRIRRPLDAAVAQAEGVLAGSYGQVTEPRVPELQRLTRAMNAMVQRVRDLFEAQAAQLLVLRQQVFVAAAIGQAATFGFAVALAAGLGHAHGAGDGHGRAAVVCLGALAAIAEAGNVVLAMHLADDREPNTAFDAELFTEPPDTEPGVNERRVASLYAADSNQPAWLAMVSAAL